MSIDQMDDYTVNLADAYAKDAYQKGYEQGKKDAAKHGHWSQYAEPHEDGKGLYICSVCNEMYVMHDDEYKFCPNCGAKMDTKPGGDSLDGEKAK